MAGDVKRRKVSGAAAPFTAVPVGSFSPCWGEAEDVGTSFPVFLAAVNRWLLALVAADIVTMAVCLAYGDILLRIADNGRKKVAGTTWPSRTTTSLRSSWPRERSLTSKASTFQLCW